VPLVVAGNKPGHEIEHPLAVVILGGLATSMLLNLFVLPPLYLFFGKGVASPGDERHNGGGDRAGREQP
ncbi:MAG: efflux RND transporter permease subunit, partial [Gemmataceae bacterium]|nr:efflux RND transporter permease subunit [Gemmataceae bacterium]